MKKKETRMIAPKLVSGEARSKTYGALPAPIKGGLKLIAAAKGCSYSWLVEQTLLEKFGGSLHRMGVSDPEYVEQKKSKVVSIRRRA